MNSQCSGRSAVGRGVILTLLMVLPGLFACTHYGQAILPPKTEFFVTTGDLATKDYQPVALVQSQRQLCRPCGLSLESAMEEIEDSLKTDLIDKAKALGANGIINLSYSTQVGMLSAGLVTIQCSGLAVKY